MDYSKQKAVEQALKVGLKRNSKVWYSEIARRCVKAGAEKVTASSVRKWLVDGVAPGGANLMTLAQVLECEPWELMEGGVR